MVYLLKTVIFYSYVIHYQRVNFFREQLPGIHLALATCHPHLDA